jgi:hypothetical protein
MIAPNANNSAFFKQLVALPTDYWISGSGVAMIPVQSESAVSMPLNDG